MRHIIRRTLETSGMTVVEAADGIDAVAAAVRERPDVALLDLHMPGCDGIEVLKHVNVMPETAATQVILLTSSNEVSDLRRAFDAGAVDYITKPCRPRELAARVERAARASREIQQLTSTSVTDDLTGLPNRRGMRMILDTISDLDSDYIGVAIIDADHFKHVNDTWGHEAGDAVLQELAHRLGRAWPTAKTARWGGEEFLVVFPARDADDVASIAERFRTVASEKVIKIPGEDAPALIVTVSVGVGIAAHRSQLGAAVTVADRAVYVAKESGRNRVVVGDMETSVSDVA